VAEIGKAGAGHQPHIACANHRDPHETICPSQLRLALKRFERVLEHFRPPRKGAGSRNRHVI
jgi:hypothetical protein